ncbi:Putative Oligosaccharyl transferase STT3 subunit [Rhizopus microsporus]|nr:Putative Oligosaccharyl transferase STT3 subunit [Rhizopus microsporus]
MAQLDVSSQKILLKRSILGLIAVVAFASRLFSIVRYESIIHEFDPWFNYRATRMLVKDGFYEFWNWFDDRSWYPLGRVVGGTVYPGLMVTAAIIHNVLHFLNFPVDIRNICVLLAPMFSGLTALATYLLTSELKDSSAGLLAAAFIGIAPGYISRSVAGSYDNEAIAIFLLMFTFYLWIKALKLGSALWASASAFFYFYMVAAWGGYVFIINLIPLHVFVLMLMGRFSNLGIYLCFEKLRDEHVFVIVYSIFASYFAGVMVRLMLTLTPVVCICGGIAISTLLDTYLKLDSGSSEKENKKEDKGSTSKKDDKSSKKKASAKSQASGILGAGPRILVVGCFTFMLMMFVWHCTWVTSNAYSSPSVVLASRNPDGSQRIIDDFREAYYWLRKNTDEDAKIMSWWDYGYQIAGFSNRTTLVDNNTWNNTHIATVGRAMATNEDDAYEIMKRHDVDYVLVIFGGLLGYSGDDINKFLWMIRIAQGIWPDKIKESDYFTATGEYRVDDQASKAMRESLMYKMSYYRFNELFGGRQPFDRVRNQPLPMQGPELSVLEEAFTSENWIVRIYKVKDYDILGRDHKDAMLFQNGKKKYKPKKSKKTENRRRRAAAAYDDID